MASGSTDRELLQEILWRLRRIEQNLGITYEGSQIGNRPRVPADNPTQGPVVPAKTSKSKPLGTRSEPPRLLEQPAPSEGEI
jgi:hypothetical protein